MIRKYCVKRHERNLQNHGPNVGGVTLRSTDWNRAASFYIGNEFINCIVYFLKLSSMSKLIS